MPGRLTVREQLDDGVCRIAVEGELDAAGAGRVGECLARALRAGAGVLAIDLSELSFIDSGGIRALLGAVEACASYHCELTFIAPRHVGPRGTFRTLGLDRVLAWSEAEPEA